MTPKTLAIDYGTVRVGLATSYWTLAEPLCILPNDNHLLDNIRATISSEGIEQVLVGVSENEMATKSRQFGQELAQLVSIPVLYADETLSSHTVQRRLRTEGIKQSTRSRNIDHFAAAQFLQEWLDEQKTEEEQGIV